MLAHGDVERMTKGGGRREEGVGRKVDVDQREEEVKTFF